MSGYMIDATAVEGCATTLSAGADGVITQSWSGVEGCGSEAVADAMEQLRGWFVAGWAGIDGDLGRAALDASAAARTLAAADADVASAAVMQGSSFRAYAV